MLMLLGFRPSSVTPILGSCPGINLARAGVGVAQNSASTRALKPYGCMMIDSELMHSGGGEKRGL